MDSTVRAQQPSEDPGSQRKLSGLDLEGKHMCNSNNKRWQRFEINTGLWAVVV